MEKTKKLILNQREHYILLYLINMSIKYCKESDTLQTYFTGNIPITLDQHEHNELTHLYNKLTNNQ